MSDRLRPETDELFPVARAASPDAVPHVLSIAGSDPSGGAGIQADLKSIAANGGYGMAVITALTAQNTQGVRDVHVPSAEFLRAQLDAVAEDIRIDAVKIGMLANSEVVRTVAEWLSELRPPVVVVDPVMVSTSDDRLLDDDGETALRALLRRADLITPNLVELAALAHAEPVDSWSTAMDLGKVLASSCGAAVLVKGGHLAGDESPDALIAASGQIRQFPGSRIATRATHGTGCSLSSALATRRARGEDWTQAVGNARSWLRESMRAGDDLSVGEGSGPVSHLAGLWRRGGIDTRLSPAQIESLWWERIADVRREIDQLPFIRSLADGTLEREPFLFYLAQDAIYLSEYARLLAHAATLAPTAHEQAFWAKSAHGAIAGELELHVSWLAPAADSGEFLFATTAYPATTAYLDHLRSVGFGGDYAELIAALLPCYWLYSDLGRRLNAGEFGAYARDPRHPYASWLSTYSDPDFADATRQAIAYVAQAAAFASDRTRERMFRAFEISARHERAFFAAPLSEKDLQMSHVRR